MSELYRRSPHLVTYWDGGQFVVENYARRKRIAASPRICEVLHLFDDWRPAAAVAAAFPVASAAELARTVAALLRNGMLDRSGAPRDPRAPAFAGWTSWSPAASFFHFSTKDGHAPKEPRAAHRELVRRARIQPMPRSVKQYRRAPVVALPPTDVGGAFARVLRSRRTWRHFARRPLGRGELATLLGLTFGVQWWVDVPGVGAIVRKTSPSGGSRHPIEAYLMALNVDGIARGLYHYNAARHRLERLRRGATSREAVRWLNGQWWFGGAAAVVLLSAVFARLQWKYPASRAYRSVLLDAGHLSQTFCLVSTALGLAPFCTMAMAESPIEAALGLDGVSESVMFALGVGARPS